MWDPPDIPGAQDVVEWFGYWPTFHDAEVLSIHLDHIKGFTVSIHAFEMTSEVDAEGHYVARKHAIVIFQGQGLPACGVSLETFASQNVLGCAYVERVPDGSALVLESSVGVAGRVVAREFSVSIMPGSSLAC